MHSPPILSRIRVTLKPIPSCDTFTIHSPVRRLKLVTANGNKGSCCASGATDASREEGRPQGMGWDGQTVTGTWTTCSLNRNHNYDNWRQHWDNIVLIQIRYIHRPFPNWDRPCSPSLTSPYNIMYPPTPRDNVDIRQTKTQLQQDPITTRRQIKSPLTNYLPTLG